MKKLLFIFCLSLLLFNCQNDDDNQENSIVPEETCEMQFDDLGLTEANAMITLGTNSIGEVVEAAWQVKYSENIVELSYENLCGDECIGKNIYVFKKLNDCIMYDYFYSVNTINQSEEWTSIYEYYFEHNFIIQEYIPDEKLVGRLVGEYNGTTQNIDFWIEFSTNDFFVEEVPDYTPFQNCLGNQLPLQIDINNDGVNDFKFTFSNDIIDSSGSTNWISVLRSDLYFEATTNNNSVLGHEVDGTLRSAGIAPGELPVSSEEFTAENHNYRVGSHADFLHENDYPYKQFNFWTSRDSVRPFFFSTLSDFHYAVKMVLNGETHYGYINMSIMFNDCEIIIHDTYLNPTPNEHIDID